MITYYVTKWSEVKELPVAHEDKVADFLYKNIFQRFGAPKIIVSDQGPQFISNMIELLMKKYQINHRNSSSYHPQVNG